MKFHQSNDLYSPIITKLLDVTFCFGFLPDSRIIAQDANLMCAMTALSRTLRHYMHTNCIRQNRGTRVHFLVIVGIVITVAHFRAASQITSHGIAPLANITCVTHA